MGRRKGSRNRGEDEGAVSEPPLETVTVVLAKEGDTLSRVITKHYGRYNEAVKQMVLLANPAIKDPNLIYVGQPSRCRT
jgi:nucleoid-associated protein YgaU